MMLKKEHLLHYLMKGHVHLSKKDYGFFNNLTYIIKEKNQVTSNQNKLFDKLVLKYQRQLRKNGHNIEQLQQLTWDVTVVDSLQEYLTPKLFLQGNVICLRTPFNTKFVQAFKVAEDNTFLWNKEDRVYRSPFYTHALRLAYDMCHKYFDSLDISDDIIKLIDSVKDIDQYTKAPVLTVVEGKYIINNMNKNLAEALKDTPLNDDPKTLYKLCRHGVKVHDDIIQNDPLKSFASNFLCKIDIDHLLDPTMDYFELLGIDTVYFPMRRVGNIDKNITSLLQKRNIKVLMLTEDLPDNVVVMRWTLGNDRTNGLAIDYRKVGKMINIVNSRPVEIR